MTPEDQPLCQACHSYVDVDGAVCSPQCLARAAHAVAGRSTPPADAPRFDGVPVGGDHAVQRVDPCPPWEDPRDRERYVCLTCGHLTGDQVRADARHALSLATIADRSDVA